MSSTKFTAETFAWLYQMNWDRNLQAVDMKVGVQLTTYFNEKDGGRAFPSCETIAKAIGVSEKTVRRSVRRMNEYGHLRVVWGQQGRGHPNQYWMVVKPAPAQVSEVDKTGIAVPVFGSDKTGIRVQKTGTAMPENHLKNHQDALRASWEGERDGASRPPPPRGAAAPEGESKKQSKAVACWEDEHLEAALDALHALWRRGHFKDDTQKQRGADREAFEAATRHAPVEDILAGAKKWVAAADAPRYLPLLSEWLTARGWEKTPPKKKPHAGKGHSRRRYGKPDVAKIMLRQEGGWIENEEGDLLNPETGKVWRNVQ